jgi:hypothetical protein
MMVAWHEVPGLLGDLKSPYGTDPISDAFQALRARLPSFSLFGTNVPIS